MTPIRPTISHPWVDERHAPLYVVSFPASATNEEVTAYCQAVEAWWPRVTEPVAFIVDASRVSSAEATQRQLLADHEKRNRLYTARYHAGSALVVSSQLIRGLITAVYWVAPPNYPHKVVTSRADAEKWVSARLAEARSKHPSPVT